MQDELEATLAKLIAIPSESADQAACKEIIEFVRAGLEPLGLHISADVESQHPWLIATTQATKSPKILLVAHLDIVPATVEGQYELKIQGERLYGRGVWDMKFAAAGYLEFFKAYQEELTQLDVGVLFTTDEEIGGYQGTAEILRQGWRADAAFVPDGSREWRVEARAKGLYITQISATGQNAHGSRPWEGSNAIQKLIPVLHELQVTYPSDDPLGPTLSVNIISGGQADNQIPDEASAWIDFRAFESSEIDEYKSTLERLAAEHGFHITEVGTGAPLVHDTQRPIFGQYMEALKAIGMTPEFQDSYGGSDARWFAECNIPSIVTYPHGNGAHGPEEWIKRQDLYTFYQILEQFIFRSGRLNPEKVSETQTVN